MTNEYLMSFLNSHSFGERLAKLRTQKGISAREMSLCLGQNTCYINHIENGFSMPSIKMFIYICEFLEITPYQFFDLEINYPIKTKRIISCTKYLSEKELEIILYILEHISNKKIGR